jgi:hypothetical protein
VQRYRHNAIVLHLRRIQDAPAYRHDKPACAAVLSYGFFVIPRIRTACGVHAIPSRGFKVAGGAIERILDLVEDVPYSVQRLAHRCWDLLRAGGPGTDGALTSAFVERALERMALEEDPAYTQLWMSLTAVQKKALKAVIKSGGRLLLSRAVTTEHPLAGEHPFLVTWLKVAQAS